MDILKNIGELITKNVNFNGNTELESLVEDLANKSAAVKGAGIEFVSLVGENESALTAANGLVDLAGRLGQSFPALSDEAATEFKDIVGKVYDNPDPAIDAAAQQVFNLSIDAVVSAQRLSDFVNTPPVEV